MVSSKRVRDEPRKASTENVDGTHTRLTLPNHRSLTIRRQIHVRLRLRWCPILRRSVPRLLLLLPVSRPVRVRSWCVSILALLPCLPVQDRLLARLHVLVELVRLVQTVHFRLFRVQPALQELGIILRKDLIAFFNLAQLELEGIDLVMEDLRRWS